MRSRLARWIILAGLALGRGAAQPMEGPDLAVISPAAASASAAIEARPSDYRVDRWQVEHGLPDNTVNALLQARDGFLWVGTARGLARFDGLEFVRVLPQAAGESDAVPVTALLESRVGDLWIGTQGEGLWRFSGGTLSRYTARERLPDPRISSLVEDAAGRIWVGTLGGMCRWDNGRFVTYPDQATPGEEPVTGLHVGRSGGLWVTTRTGVSRLSGDRLVPFNLRDEAEGRSAEYNGVFEDRRGDLWAYGDTFLLNLSQGRRFNYFKSSDPSASRVWTIFEDRSGALWIGTSGRGLFVFRDRRFEPLALPEGGALNDIRAILEDSERNLWVGTSGAGLACLQLRPTRQLGTAQGLPRNPTCTVQDAQGATWVGFDGAGLWQATGAGFRRIDIDGSAVLTRRVWALAAAKDGTVWVGTWGNGLCRLHRGVLEPMGLAHGLADTIIRCLSVDPAQSVWVGYQSGYVQCLGSNANLTFGPRQGLTAKPVIALLTRRNGETWTGTAGGGAQRRSGDRFLPVASPDIPQDAEVGSLFEDAAGCVWMGTANGILGCWMEGTLHTGALPAGPTKSRVSLIQEDAQGNLWVGTDRGILEIKRDAREDFSAGRSSVLHGRWHGLEEGATTPGSEGSPAGFRSSEGFLTFRTGSGLAVLDPAAFEGRRLPPQARIEALLLDGEPLGGQRSRPPTPSAETGEQRLPPKWGSLELRFTAPSLTSPRELRFRHRLENLDADWVESGAARQVRYGRLPPGVYRFSVNARYESEAWGPQQATVSFLVPTPWWRAWWSLSLAGALSLSSLVLLVRWVLLRRLRRRMARLRQEHALERERSRIAQDMHDEIGAKLTRISFLSELARQRDRGQPAVETHLHSIAETSRQLLHSLDEIVWAVNPRNDNLEQLVAYLGQYASEYLQNTGVEYRLEAPPQLPACALTAESRHSLFLAFEEVLGNALKHAHASLISVRMQLQPASLEITVTDNGRGFLEPPEPLPDAREPGRPLTRSPNGLHNMRSRMTEIGGECRITSTPEVGTTVTLVIPIQPGGSRN